MCNLPASLLNTSFDLPSSDLSENHIQSIDANDFVNMTNLRKLLLANNSISVIDSNSFGDLFRLEVLKLSQNLISQIYQGSFAALVSLKSL